MTSITSDDGIQLHVEEAGAGTPIIFIHEFAGDHQSWEPQMRWFARTHRVITYAARGYPPSDVPADVSAYSQARAATDAVNVLDGLGIDKAHVVGLSMGGFCALHVALRYPKRALSAVVAGAGYGAHPDVREKFRSECEAIAQAFETEELDAFASRYAEGPARVQLQNKDPRGWTEFRDALSHHDRVGAANTMRGVQMERPSLYALRDQLAQIAVPILVLLGDEDSGAIDASVMMKATIPTAGLAVLPRTGHTANLEEPMLFNRLVGDFITSVDAGRCASRDPRSLVASTTGIEQTTDA